MENKDKPAFPITQDTMGNDVQGLTKRELIAAMALASGSTPKDAVAKADALLDALSKQ